MDKIKKLLKKILLKILDFLVVYEGIAISTIIAWLYNFSKDRMDTTTSYLIMTLTIVSVLIFFSKMSFSKEKNKQLEKKDKREIVPINDNVLIQQSSLKAIKTALNPDKTGQEIGEAIIKTTTIIERIIKFMKDKIVKFFKLLWGNKLTISNIIASLMACGVADYLVLSDHLMRFEFFASNPLAYKIGAIVGTILYLVLDIGTTINKRGWENLIELEIIAKEKEEEKQSRLTSEQKAIYKAEKERIKANIKEATNTIEKAEIIIKRYELLTNSNNYNLTSEDTIAYQKAINEKANAENCLIMYQTNLKNIKEVL